MILIEQTPTVVQSGTIDSSTTIDLAAGTPQTLIVEDPSQFDGTIEGLSPGDQIILSNTGSVTADAVVAATIGTINGVATLQVLESPDNDPVASNTGTIDIPVAGATAPLNETNTFFQVSSAGAGTATALTLLNGNETAESVGADTAWQTYGITGAGIRVGIISDSFNALGDEAADIATGALPVDVTVLSDDSTGRDEGRVMAQAVHDVAPGAAIYFASGASGPAGFAGAVAALQAAGCEIIVDDLAFLGSVNGVPADGPNGVIDTAINTAVNDGVTYVTAADNYRKFGVPVFGHAADSLALTVGAINILATPSSVGGYVPPQTEFFSSAGATAAKPNITGPDGFATTFPLFPGSEESPAFGTSVAAPVVAGVAALMMQENPSLDVSPLTVDRLLEQTATSFGEPANQMGAGLVNAAGAVAAAADLVPCFVIGTTIATAHGGVAVEHLRIGDLVATLSGGFRPVRWIGRRRIDLARHPEPQRVQPVRVRAGAISSGVPERDLLLSGDHAVLLDGSLIPVRLLINGASILPAPECLSVVYYHIELDQHDVILAEQLPAESYLDTGNRWALENAGAATALFPDLSSGQAARQALSCAPFAADAARVEPVWRRLASRARDLGLQIELRQATTDPNLVLHIGNDEDAMSKNAPHHAQSGRYLGRTVQAVCRETNRFDFVIPFGCYAKSLVSRTKRPCDLTPWIDDQRLLGVRVRRMTLHQGALTRDIALDDPALAKGWWALESEGCGHSRWTNGNAMLPRLSKGILSIQLAETSEYLCDVSVRECGGNWIDVHGWAGPEGGVAARRVSPARGRQT